MSDLLAPLVAAGTAAAVGAVVAALLLRCAGSLPHDRPNARSLHLRPVPRVGGLAVWAGALAGWAAAGSPRRGRRGGREPSRPRRSARWRSPSPRWPRSRWRMTGPDCPPGCACRSTSWRGSPPPTAILPDAGWPLRCALAVTLAWAANLYNFMDGSDGLAASMAVCGFGALAGGAALGAGPGGWLAPAAAAIAGGAIALLAFNAPPARLFMGDVGSVPLGFAAAALGALGVALGRWPPWFPLLVFLPFVADATVTLARRTLAGERVYEAHRGHYYQRLWQMGAGHRGTLAVYAALAAATASTALGILAWFPRYGPLALAAWIAIIAAGFAGIDYHWRLHCTKSR